jgi:hypothetical protein
MFKTILPSTPQQTSHIVENTYDKLCPLGVPVDGLQLLLEDMGLNLAIRRPEDRGHIRAGLKESSYQHE